MNLEKSELEPKQIFDFVGYQFDLRAGQVRPTLDCLQNLQDKILEILSLQACPVRQYMRRIQWHLKNNWRIPVIRKSDSNSQVPAPSLTMVARRRQHSHRPTITPNKTCSADFYRRIKRSMGRSLKRTHCKRVLVTARKQAAYQLSGTKSFSSSERVPRPLYKQDSTCGNQQHYSSGIHKQGRRHEVGPTLCPIVEDLDLVHQETSNFHSPTHPRPAECGSKAIQTGPDHPNRVAPPSRGLQNNMQQVAPASNRPFCYEVQQVASICATGTGSGTGHSNRCTQSTMGGSGCICLLASGHLGQSGGEVAGLPMQKNHSDYSGVAQHALVLGPSGHVQSDSTEPAQSAQPANTALQSDPSQKFDKPESPCMAPRATTIKEQAFSEAVTSRIEAPQKRINQISL